MAKPHTIYTRPYNVFVSTFIGHSNLFNGKIRLAPEGKFVVFDDGYELLMQNLGNLQDDQSVVISVHPEELSVQAEGVKCKIKSKVFLGKYINFSLSFEASMLLPGQTSIEFSQDLGHANTIYEIGDLIVLRPNKAKINVFTEE